MDIAIIGSGNVATILGRKFKTAGHNILQIVSRNESAAAELAEELGTESTNYMTLLNPNAEVYLVAVSDDAIEKVITGLELDGKIIAHTAASVPKEVLKNVSGHYGVLYPLQSMRKEMTDLPDIPVFFDGNDEVAKRNLELLANSISSQPSTTASDDQRLNMHVAAVIVSNFVNHLYVLAEDYCKKEGLAFKQLVPLIEETAQKIKTMSPQQAQTGPAIRHDKETIQKHLEILEKHPHLKSIYVLFTESIQQEK